ncbi:hypothetical protein GOV11_04940 [Candidatus Woesearchaeota archaeon]|nr:hypothetical protein [Candidatus Woesearchaeota archaeon]
MRKFSTNMWDPKGRPGDKRKPECDWLYKGDAWHWVNLQTGRAVLNIEKLKEKVAKGIPTHKFIKLAKQKLEVLERSNFQCMKCGTEDCLTIDHVRGFRQWENQEDLRGSAEGYVEDVQVLCIWCHGYKDGWWRF